MTYALLDDGFYDHPNFANIPDDLVGVWAKGLAYCNRHLTDGRIPIGTARRFCVTSDQKTIVERMVDAGLWTADFEDVWHIGYLDHNPSRAKVKAKLKKAKSRKDKWNEQREGMRSETRLKTAPERVPNAVPNGVPNGVQSNPIRSDPNTPIAPLRESVRELARRAYAEGATTALGVQTFSLQDSEADVIVRVVRDSAHWSGLRGDSLATAIRNSAAKYIAARRDEPQFERGYAPSKWAEWLRSGGGKTQTSHDPQLVRARAASAAVEAEEASLRNS